MLNHLLLGQALIRAPRVRRRWFERVLPRQARPRKPLASQRRHGEH
ncbi:hypothetical protein [Acuticoccus sp.]